MVIGSNFIVLKNTKCLITLRSQSLIGRKVSFPYDFQNILF